MSFLQINAQSGNIQQFIHKKNAPIVINMNPSATMDKLDTAFTNAMNLSATIAPLLAAQSGNVTNERMEQLVKLLDTDGATGLSLKGDIYAWMSIPEQANAEADQMDNMILNLAFGVEDKNKLESFLNAVFENNLNNKSKKHDFSYIIQNSNLISWNDQRMTISRCTRQQSFFEDELTYNQNIAKSLNDFVDQLAKPEYSASLASDKNYQQHLQNGSDLDLWMDYETYGKLLNRDMPAELSQIYASMMKAYGDIKLGMNIFMNDGEMRIKTEVFMSESMAKIMDGAYDQEINKEFFKYVKGENPLALYAFAINPKGIYGGLFEEMTESLNSTKEGKIMNDMIGIIDIFLDQDEIYSLFRGDMLFVLSDFRSMEIQQKDYVYNEKKDNWEEIETTKTEILPIMSLLFSFGSKENMMKFIALGIHAEMLNEVNEGLWNIKPVSEELGMDVYLLLKDDFLMVTNDVQINEYSKNGFPKKEQFNNEMVDLLLSKTAFGKIDLKAMSNSLKALGEQKSAPVPVDVVELMNKFDLIELSVNDMLKNELTSELIISMQDKSQNILQQVMGLAQGFMQSMMNQGTEDIMIKKL